jgi:hypothetical protein
MVGGGVHPRTRRDAFQDTTKTDHHASTETQVPQITSTGTPRRRKSLEEDVELEDAEKLSIAVDPCCHLHHQVA